MVISNIHCFILEKFGKNIFELKKASWCKYKKTTKIDI